VGRQGGAALQEIGGAALAVDDVAAEQGRELLFVLGGEEAAAITGAERGEGLVGRGEQGELAGAAELGVEAGGDEGAVQLAQALVDEQIHDLGQDGLGLGLGLGLRRGGRDDLAGDLGRRGRELGEGAIAQGRRAGAGEEQEQGEEVQAVSDHERGATVLRIGGAQARSAIVRRRGGGCG
jgi:hypothetical protein